MWSCDFTSAELRPQRNKLATRLVWFSIATADSMTNRIGMTVIVLCSCEQWCEANVKHVWRDVYIAMIVRWGCLEGRVHSHGCTLGLFGGMCT